MQRNTVFAHSVLYCIKKCLNSQKVQTFQVKTMLRTTRAYYLSAVGLINIKDFFSSITLYSGSHICNNLETFYSHHPQYLVKMYRVFLDMKYSVISVIMQASPGDKYQQIARQAKHLITHLSKTQLNWKGQL